MVTVTINEPMVNAITAALYERNARLARNLSRLNELREQGLLLDPVSRADNAFAVEVTEAAIRDTTTAILAIAAALEEPDFPADMTMAMLDWAPGEYVEAFGR